MEKRKVSSQGFFRMLLILFVGMLMSQVATVGVFLFLYFSGGWGSDPFAEALIYGAPALACIAFGLSLVLSSKLINEAAEKSKLADKLRGYQTAFIIRMALLEGASILGALGFLLTGQFFLLAVNAVALVFFALAFPSRDKVIEGLRLSSPEIELVNDPNAIVLEYDFGTGD